MKVLIVFTDMIRSNRLKTCNSKILKKTPLDNVLNKIWWTIYTECFSPTPDTPRWMACLYTWLWPKYNWCDIRIKYPKFYLKKKSFFDLFLEKKYKISCFSNPSERKTWLFPKNIDKLNIHNKDYNLDNYLKNIKLNKDHLLFISLPDFHHSISQIWATIKWEIEWYIQLEKSINIIFDNYKKNDFDHIIFFSDHWFKFYDEWFDYKKELPLLLNEDRINSLMFHRKKWDETLIENNKLISTTNLFWFLENILNKKDISQLSLYNNKVKYIVWEDHINFNTNINQFIWIWYYLDKNILYVRTLYNWYIFNRKSNKYKIKIDINLDSFISNNSQFKDYIKRKNILDMYNDSAKEKKKIKYPNWIEIKKVKYPDIINKILIVLYIIKIKILNKVINK